MQEVKRFRAIKESVSRDTDKITRMDIFEMVKKRRTYD